MSTQSNNRPRVVAIVGPTAVGKSALAIELALALNGEIISCDSMQIYRGMDIGTAKATPEEMARVPHHLIDIKNPDEDFSCADYAILARRVVNDILSRGRLPIFCGGTGLYLDSVVEIPSFADTVRDDAYRERLESFVEKYGAHELHEILMAVDPESGEQIHENNVKRVIRALEIYHLTKRKKSELDAESRLAQKPYELSAFFLTCKDKELLYSRIDSRVDIMLEQGLVDECRALYERGLLENGSTASMAIGYKELIPYLKGEASLESCVNQLKLSTRHYAKRQLTWFKRKEGYHTIYVDEENALECALNILK